MIRNVQDHIWAFDCEWVPDPCAGRLLYKLPADMPDREVLAVMWRENGATPEEPTPFLKTVLCRVISIAAVRRRVVRDKDGKGATVKLDLLWLPRDPDSAEQQAESAVIGTFLQALGKFKPQLVGYNSRAADLRILVQRAVAKDAASGAYNFSERRGSIESDPMWLQATLPETCQQRVKIPKPEKAKQL